MSISTCQMCDSLLSVSSKLYCNSLHYGDLQLEAIIILAQVLTGLPNRYPHHDQHHAFVFIFPPLLKYLSKPCNLHLLLKFIHGQWIGHPDLRVNLCVLSLWPCPLALTDCPLQITPLRNAGVWFI